MDEALTLRRLLWNSDEGRLRALLRAPVVLALVLLAAQVLDVALEGLRSAVGVPNPLFATLWLGALTVVVVAVAWFVDKRRRRDMGLGLSRRWWLDAAAGLVVGIGMVATVVAVLRVAGMAVVGGPHRAENPAIALGDSPAATLLYGFVLFAAVAALEEFVVRGYLLTNVAEGIRGVAGDDTVAVGVAVLATAALFGVLHAANPAGSLLSLLNVALAGVLLGGAYAATGRIAFPVGLHTTWNFGLGPLFGLPVSGLTTDAALVPVRVEGPRLVTGGGFGPEGGLVMLAALAVGTGALVWWLRHTVGGVALDGRVAVPDLWAGSGDDS
jgi:membrane protease YdiL (CAAX protease family)